MLNPMCHTSWCRSIEVTRRYHWPSATPSTEPGGGVGSQARPSSTRSSRRDSGATLTRMKTARLMPSRILVTSRGSAARVPPASVRGVLAEGWWPVPEPWRTQSGHWKPTEALTMHSVQIGRSQRVQLIPVSRPGCR
ncbi:hypothetical protein SMICM304S_07835 [Streptomyces microflavus]